jgi:signal peptidase I
VIPFPPGAPAATVLPRAPRRSGWGGRPVRLARFTARSLLGTLVLLVLVSVLPTAAGWETSVVMSGSMAPTVQPGDVTLVRPVAPADLRPGQVLLVDDPDVPGQLRLHRLVSVESGGLRLRGDANPQADSSLVDPAAVHGVGALRLPMLGAPVLWAAQHRFLPLASTALVLGILVGLALLSGPPGPPGPRDGSGTPAASAPSGRRSAGRPRSRSAGRRARVRPAGAAAATLIMLVLASPAVGGAHATFSAVAANPASTWNAAANWTCGSAATSASAQSYFSLQDAAGPTAVNGGTRGAAGNGTYSSAGVTYGVAGPDCSLSGDTAVRLDGASGAIWTSQLVTNPQSFSTQAWFSTTTTRGGWLVGFGSGAGGSLSSDYDRQVFMTNSGQLTFGVYNNAVYTATSPAAYNDGRWHLVTATFSAGTQMQLYVDGALVASNTATTAAQVYNGYWRIGYDNLANWTGTPASNYFAGSLAHVSIYNTPLSAAAVAAQYTAGPWTCAAAAGPNGAGAVSAFSLQERSGNTAGNTGSTGTAGNGTFAGAGVTYDVAGPACGHGADRAVRLDGASGRIWTTQVVTNPQSFTVQVWFRTTTTSGGKLIGFGNGTAGATSSSYDRHVYLTNGGQLVFGVYNGATYTVTSPAAYNDGTWHLATATFSPGTGMKLYADGTLVGQSSAPTAAESYTGYWRIGQDNLGSWPSAPTSSALAGSVAYASIFDRPLTAAEVAGQYNAGR